MTAPPETSAQREGPAQPVDPALARALADELVTLTRSLGDLAFDLGKEPETLRRHMASLQAIDHITQAQLVVADLLRSDAPLSERIEDVPLQDMADRLRAALS